MTIRLNKVTRNLNVGIATVVDFLQKQGYTVEANPNTKITEEQYAALVKEFSKDKDLKIESEKISQERQNKEHNMASVSIEGLQARKKKPEEIETVVPADVIPQLKPVGKIDLDSLNKKKVKAASAGPVAEKAGKTEPEALVSENVGEKDNVSAHEESHVEKPQDIEQINENLERPEPEQKAEGVKPNLMEEKKRNS